MSEHEIYNKYYYNVRNDPYYIDSLDIQPRKLCRLAIKKNPEVIEYVKNQTPELCKLAIKLKPSSFRYIKKENQTSEICKLALSLHSRNIVFMRPEFQTFEFTKFIGEDRHIIDYFNIKQEETALVVSLFLFCFYLICFFN